MPYSDYKCNTCDTIVEIKHDMVSFSEMSAEQIDNLRCKNEDCANCGEIMSKLFVAPHLGWSSGGKTGATKEVLGKKQKERKLRSKKHFKHQVLPTLNETPKIMDHFKKKFKDI
jgi:hypothetical protein